MKQFALHPAPTANAADPGNRFDTDETTDALMEHNVALRAACEDDDDGR